MFLLFLLTSCPHHHHADCDPIVIIDSMKEVYFDEIDTNTLVVFGRHIKPPKPVMHKLRVRHIAVHIFKSQKNLKKCFRQPGYSFNKILFFDRRKKTVSSVAKVAEDLGVAYRGYIYKTADI